VEDSLAPQQRDFSNADYVFKPQNVVAELKVLTRDQSSDPAVYEKLQGLYLSAVKEGLVGPIFGTVKVNTNPDGHPNSPVYGHLKLPHLN